MLVEGAGTGWSMSVSADGAGGAIAAASDQGPGDLRVQRLELVGATITPTTASVVLEPSGSTVVDVAGDAAHAVIAAASGGHATADLWQRSRITDLAPPGLRITSPPAALRG